MRIIRCDVCGKEDICIEDLHTVSITYVDGYGVLKPFMKALELCPTCAFRLKGNIVKACKEETQA